MPSGTAISIHRSAPPSTTEAVTGAARATTSFTDWRFPNDCPNDGDENRTFHTSCSSRFQPIPESRPRKAPY
jgi:hypothetical protein